MMRTLLLLALLALVACDDPPAAAEPEPEWLYEQTASLAEMVTLDPMLHPTEGRLFLPMLGIGAGVDAVAVVPTGQRRVTVFVVGAASAEVRVNGVWVAGGGQITIHWPEGG